MSYRLITLLSVLLFCFNSWAYAEQRIFQVELIVFQQQAPNSEIFEQVESEIVPVARYARASTGNKTLHNIYNRLKRASAYQPFYYRSWRIPVGSGSVSLPINVAGVDANLQGWIKVQRGHLLHVLVDFEFSPPASGGGEFDLSLKRKKTGVIK